MWLSLSQFDFLRHISVFIIDYGQEKMQERLTYSKFYRPSESPKKRGVFRLLIFLILSVFVFGFFVSCLISFAGGASGKIYKESEVYYLSLGKFSSQRAAEEGKGRIEKAGGAGYIYKSAADYHVVAFFYLERQDAEKVQDAAMANFPAEVLVRSFKKVSRAGKRCIKSQDEFVFAFKYLDKITNQLYADAVAVDKGEKGAAELYRSAVGFCENAKEHCDKISRLELYEKNMKRVAAALEECLKSFMRLADDFLTDIYRGESLTQKSKYFAVSYCEIYANLRENLAKI